MDPSMNYRNRSIAAEDFTVTAKAEMGARATPEWIGKHPDTPVPLRVKLRILGRQNNRCTGCTRKFGGGWAKAQFDHRPALINGGQNRESMIEAVCKTCHEPRTKADIQEKAYVADLRAKHLGLKKAKRPMAGSRQSRWKKKMDGSVVRRP